MSAMGHWYDSRKNTARLMRWLAKQDGGMDAADCAELDEHPEWWAEEWEAMIAEEPQEKRSAASMAAELMGEERA
jgi:hypothetical protein